MIGSYCLSSLEPSGGACGSSKYRRIAWNAARTRPGSGADGGLSHSVRVEGGVPGPPSNVSFPDVTTTTARIIWDVPREPNGEILGYRIAFWLHHSGGGSSEGEARVSREVPRHGSHPQGLRPGGGAAPPRGDCSNRIVVLREPQSYYAFAVSARTKEGWGLEARALVLTTASREKPQAPSRPLVSPSQVQARHLTLSWTPGRDGFAPLRCYLLQKIEAGGPWKELPQKIDPGATTYTVADLRPATRYLFRLRAVNDLGFSPWSEESNETWTLPAGQSASTLAVA
ncbi:protein sidekick [Ixodes scapularis]